MWGEVTHALYGLSIHDLTRRSTEEREVISRYIDLSIHDLTRRSTKILDAISRILYFQFTTSQGGRHVFREV